MFGPLGGAVRPLLSHRLMHTPMLALAVLNSVYGSIFKGFAVAAALAPLPRLLCGWLAGCGGGLLVDTWRATGEPLPQAAPERSARCASCARDAAAPQHARRSLV